MVTILTRISCEDTMRAARSIWISQETADIIGANALQILARASDANIRFFNGKASKSLLGGLFYLLGHRFNEEMTQNQIAAQLGISEVSVRRSYKDWLNMFPYFFTDLASKMKAPRTTTKKNMPKKKPAPSAQRIYLKACPPPTFNDLLLESVDDAISILSTPVKAILYTHLEDDFKIKKCDIPLKIDVFSDALEAIFGEIGSRHIEILIMKKLFEKLKATYKWSAFKLSSREMLAPGVTFKGYILLARQNFETKTSSKTEIAV